MILKKSEKTIIVEIKAAKESYKKKEYSEEELLALAGTALGQIETMRYYEAYQDEYTKDGFIGHQNPCAKAFDVRFSENIKVTQYM